MSAPITGWWTVESGFDLAPDGIELIKDALETAAANGEQVVTVEGIEFRWHPVASDDADLYDHLAAVHRIVHGDRCDLCVARLEQSA